MRKMKRKYKLKKWIKYSLIVIVLIMSTIIVAFICIASFKDLDKLAKECDAKMGYTCSYYDIRKYSIRG